MKFARRPLFIQYVGSEGVSRTCIDAVRRFIQYGDALLSALVLTHDQEHALLLQIDELEQAVVKPGFTSGYPGEGPRTFAKVLRLLALHGVEVEECCVDRALMQRVKDSRLKEDDFALLKSLPRVRPIRVHDYIYDALGPSPQRHAWLDFREVMPWRSIDPRLEDLALRFFDAPEDNLLRGFKRLETVVSTRTQIKEYGAKLFHQAFLSDESALCWPALGVSEQKARGQLFVATFGAFRNPRAHQELDSSGQEFLEFLALNHLFVLERSAVLRDPG